MIIQTKFNNGDKVHVITRTGAGTRIVSGPLTIGQISATVTSTPGIPGLIFENYLPQASYCEEYMCIETGVGSGQLYQLVDIFPDVISAGEELKKREEDK